MNTNSTVKTTVHATQSAQPTLNQTSLVDHGATQANHSNRNITSNISDLAQGICTVTLDGNASSFRPDNDAAGPQL
jgi:hypothetical protein